MGGGIVFDHVQVSCMGVYGYAVAVPACSTSAA